MKVKRWLLWGSLAAGIGLNAGLFFFLIVPLMQEESRLEAAMKELRHAKAAAVHMLDQQSIDQEEIEHIKKQLPPADEHLYFLQQIHQLGQNSRVIVQSAAKTGQTELKDSGLEQQILAETFHLTLKGPYPSIQHFVRSLYRLDRIIEMMRWDLQVDDLTLAQEDLEWSNEFAGAIGAGELIVRAALTIRLYYAAESLFDS